MNLNNVHIFSCEEHLKKRKLAKKFLVITVSQLLSFGILNEEDNIVQLEKQYYIYELQKIQVRPEKDNINVLQLDFLVQGDEGNEESQLTVELKQSGQFIEKIKENIQRLDLQQVLPKKIQISEDDVTIKAYQSTDIELIESCIASLTIQIEDDGLKLTDINQLTELYQKAIEFYSAIADDKFMIFMQSLKELLQREDVQRILQDKQESINAEKANQLRVSNANEQQQQQQQLGEEKKEENEHKTAEYMDNQNNSETKSDTQDTISRKLQEQDSIFSEQTNQHKDQQEQNQSEVDNNQASSGITEDSQEKQKEKDKNLEEELLDKKKQQEQEVKQSKEDITNQESQMNEQEDYQKIETQEQQEEVNNGGVDQEKEVKQESKDENEQVEGEREQKNDDNKYIEQDQQEDQEQIPTNEEENNQQEEGNEESNQSNKETGDNQDNIKKPASKKGQQKKPPGRANKGSSKKA